MVLEIGSRLGHYQVSVLIGEGGMGQVYQATDTTLNRRVAPKILPEGFASSSAREGLGRGFLRFLGVVRNAV